MIKIDETTNSIYMTRGDYEAIIFSAYGEDETLFQLNEGDKVVFELGKKWGSPLLHKEKIKEDSSETTTADYTIEILAEDTKPLKFGEYVFDVAITTTLDETTTYISGNFNITEEVGAKEGALNE